MKKHEKILAKLELELSQLEQFCYMNDMKPNQFMEGKLKVMNDMIEYIKKL